MFGCWMACYALFARSAPGGAETVSFGPRLAQLPPKIRAKLAYFLNQKQSN
jgi:hypothetical protein